jgi:hypothetical protein
MAPHAVQVAPTRCEVAVTDRPHDGATDAADREVT